MTFAGDAKTSSRCRHFKRVSDNVTPRRRRPQSENPFGRQHSKKASRGAEEKDDDDDARKPQPEPENWEYKYLYDGACPVCRSLKAGLEGTT